MRSSIAFVLASSAIAVLGGCTQKSGEDPSLLLGRVWVDSTPDKPTDYIQGAYLLPRPAVGIFQRASAYDLHFERFDYARDGQKLQVTFPQNGKKTAITYTVTACNTHPPYDLCLDLSENPWGGPKRYYATRQQDDDDAALRGMRAHLTGR